MIMSYEEAIDIKEGDIVTVAPLLDIIANAKEKGYFIRMITGAVFRDVDNVDDIDSIYTPCHFIKGMFNLCGKEFRVAEVKDKGTWVRFLLRDIRDATRLSYCFDNYTLLSNEEEKKKTISDEDFDTLFGGIE